MDNKYRFLEEPIKGEYNYILSFLYDRYILNKHTYVLVLHLNQHNHYICGLFDDMRECLIARTYANIALKDINDDQYFQAHRNNGVVLTDIIYDIKTNLIKEVEIESS